MSELPSVGIGLVGAGFLARTRARCYAKAAGVHARLAAVCSSTPQKAADFAARHGVTSACSDLDELLACEDVQLVDLCVPNHLHRPFAERATAAGKHVACTKPLSAYVGQDLPDGTPDADVSAVPRAQMLERATADAAAMVAAARRHGVQLMYGENWVYAPAIRRALDLVATSRGAVLELRGWEGHSGSHSAYSKLWRYAGGGALLRLGAHPLGAMLHLKRLEGEARDGRPILPVAVTAEVADVTPAAEAAQAVTELATGWVDVESWGCAIVAFDDGSRAVAYGSDTLLGGMQSRLEVMGSNFQLACNLSPHDLLRAYAARPEVFADLHVMEKAGTPAGWNTFLPDEDWTSGQVDMCHDFALAAAEGRPALSGGELGLEVTRLIYSAYVSAAEGQRIAL